ncbi:hypothetical protein V6N11_052259 [Hibiscus sabdariffa]|uniref:Uncharacterized protein n=1 Tax=Hibiscus sabdariffa TaxID=183260 RepID=A0ABR2U9N7_9ROSI
MGCLYSVFDVKKQGKPIWEVRTKNWKLRGGEDRLSGLLEVQISAILVSSIGTLSVVSVPKSNTGIWVSVPAREGIGTPCSAPGLFIGVGPPGLTPVFPVWPPRTGSATRPGRGGYTN